MAPPLCCRQTRLLASGAISATEIPYSPGPKVMGSVASLVWLKKKKKKESVTLCYDSKLEKALLGRVAM